MCLSIYSSRVRNCLSQREEGRVQQAYLGNPSPQIASDEELVALQLSLDDDEGEIGLGVHVASQILDLLNLSLDPVIDALKEAILRPTRRLPESDQRR